MKDGDLPRRLYLREPDCSHVVPSNPPKPPKTDRLPNHHLGPTIIMSKQPDKEVSVETRSTASSAAEPSKPGRTNFIKSLFHKDKTSDESESDPKDKKKSISSSGPFIFVTDPTTGKETLRENPHWPDEDSWKEVERSKGTWAMGGEMGDASKDFGGTVG